MREDGWRRRSPPWSRRGADSAAQCTLEPLLASSPGRKARMRIRFRPQITTPGRWIGSRSGLAVAGLMLAGAVRAFEDPESTKPATSAAARTPSPAEVRLQGRRDLPGGRRARGRGPAPGDRGGGRLHLVRLQVGRAQARPGSRRLFPAVRPERQSPTLGKHQELAFAGPGDKRLEGRLKTDFIPLAIGTGGTLKTVPDRLRRLRDHGQGRVAEARLRRLCGRSTSRARRS